MQFEIMLELIGLQDSLLNLSSNVKSIY